MNKNIVLIGMRGSGKSEIGAKIAKLLGRTFVDLDKKIIQYANMSIMEMVEKKGWKYFRELEKKITEKISKKKRLIIATGGGTIIDPKNEKNLRQNGFIVLLECDIPILAERIKKDSNNRPSLTGKSVTEELEEIWKKRQKRYKKSADLIFNTNLDGIEEKVKKLILLLPQN